MTWLTILKLRPSGARALDWFCMRGRSVEERAIGILATRPGSSGRTSREDIMPFVNRYKARILRFSKTVAARMDRAAYADAESLLVLFLLLRLLLRRSEPLEALEQLFFGHAIDRHLGIVGIDGAAGRADKRRRLRLGLVDLDVLLQRVNELLLEVVRGYRSLGDFPQGDDRIF